MLDGIGQCRARDHGCLSMLRPNSHLFGPQYRELLHTYWVVRRNRAAADNIGSTSGTQVALVEVRCARTFVL